MFEHVPLYPLVPVLFAVAVVLFALQMARHLRVFASAQSTVVTDHPEARFASLIRYSIAQVRMFRDLSAGLLHAAIFWGFVILTIGTADRVTGGLVHAVLAWPFEGLLWRLLLPLQNLLALGVLAGVAYALFRRLVTRPRRLTLSKDGLTILLLIAGVVLTELLAEAFRLGRYGDPDAAWSVVGNPMGQVFAAVLPPAALEILFPVFFWANVALVAGFLIYLPRSKHLHIATAFFNTAFRRLRPRGQLPPVDLEAEDARFGVKTIEDLHWKDLLDGFTCTECGRCQDACPAWATGKPLNPKTMIMGIREMSVEAEAGLPLIPGLSRLGTPAIPFIRGRDRRTDGVDGAAATSGSAFTTTAATSAGRDGTTARTAPKEAPVGAGRADIPSAAAPHTAVSPSPAGLAQPIVDTAIPYDAVWDCVTCGACVEACPVLIEHVDKIIGLRRNLVLEESRFPQELTTSFTNMERYSNIWGQPQSGRLDWAKALPFEVPTAAQVAQAGPDAVSELECLYWVGCAASFDDRNRKVARAFVTCLDAAGVSFAVLGQEESCTGDPARRMGNEYVWQMLATSNIATLDRYRPKTIVTACPHCFNTIGNEYSQLGGHYRVVHHSQFLSELVAEGRLRPEGERAGALTYHDSCYLTRYNGVVMEPRAALSAVPGIELREMERNGKDSFCCGAGGGRMWMEETRGTRINVERTRQALETGAESVATACPFCLVMMRDGLAAAPDRRAGDVGVQDISEVIAASLRADGTGSGGSNGRSLPVIQ